MHCLVKDRSGAVINRISADTEFMKAHYESWEWEVAETPEMDSVTVLSLAKMWRDDELKATDWIVPLSDHPERSGYMTYRTALRDWPSTSDFPATKPTLGS